MQESSLKAERYIEKDVFTIFCLKLLRNAFLEGSSYAEKSGGAVKGRVLRTPLGHESKNALRCADSGMGVGSPSF